MQSFGEKAGSLAPFTRCISDGSSIETKALKVSWGKGLYNLTRKIFLNFKKKTSEFVKEKIRKCDSLKSLKHVQNKIHHEQSQRQTRRTYLQTDNGQWTNPQSFLSIKIDENRDSCGWMYRRVIRRQSYVC